MISIRTLPLLGLTGLSLVLTVPTADAQIPNYLFRGIDGLGALSGQLSDRLGYRASETEHYINVDDCKAYTDGSARWKHTISPLPLGSWTYGTAHSAPGQTCPTTSSNIDPTNPDLCFVVDTQKELTGNSEFEVDVPFNELMGLTGGGSCGSNTEATARVYIVIEEPAQISVSSQIIDVIVDLKAPDMVTNVAIEPGNQRFVVSWDDETNDPDQTLYDVYWDDVDFTENALDSVRSTKGITNKSIAIESVDIINGVQYYVRVAAVDKADNLSTLSPTETVIAEETHDFWSEYKSSGGKELGDFCFIATASYGAGMSAELATLRAFRDQVLLRTASGRVFVDSYYRYGRFAAAWIADKPVLKAVVRVLLVPLIWLAQLMLWFGPLGALAALGSLVIVGVRLKRTLQAHVLRDLPVEVAQ